MWQERARNFIKRVTPILSTAAVLLTEACSPAKSVKENYAGRYVDALTGGNPEAALLFGLDSNNPETVKYINDISTRVRGCQVEDLAIKTYTLSGSDNVFEQAVVEFHERCGRRDGMMDGARSLAFSFNNSQGIVTVDLLSTTPAY